MPLKDWTARATQLARRQREALVRYADRRFGHAAHIVTGVCMDYSSESGILTIREDGTSALVYAERGGLTVTEGNVVGERVLTLSDPQSHRLYFRFVLEADGA